MKLFYAKASTTEEPDAGKSHVRLCRALHKYGSVGGTLGNQCFYPEHRPQACRALNNLCLVVDNPVFVQPSSVKGLGRVNSGVRLGKYPYTISWQIFFFKKPIL